MWECARADNVPYYEHAMEKVKAVFNDVYEALHKIDRKKWTRYAFCPLSNCLQLVNNWADAFNVFIINARDQPIIAMLNIIYYTIMTWIEEERERKMKCKGLVCPRVNELLVLRGKRVNEFITRSSRSPRYEVSYVRQCFVVDIEKRTCSCELWQLGGIPCVHAVCVFRSLNKDPRKYVHQTYLKTTFLEVYSHTLEPLNGPIMWTKSSYPDILPTDIRVLPRRPKRCRRVDPSEAREKKEKEVAEKAKKASVKGIFKASRHEAVIHCKICGSVGHNVRTCPRKPAVAASSQPAATSSSQPATSIQPRASTQPATASSQPVAATPRPASTQPTRRSSRKKYI
ncbi:hypothetical protein LIER_03004 [Lithospermum erythrorhizon]|uniref:SWIM-type domain-containing protein n=1 Tax=Lithospermum erythrorhizon TaxID=34254 RepID=A0AAV3NW96_LITER